MNNLGPNVDREQRTFGVSDLGYKIIIKYIEYKYEISFNIFSMVLFPILQLLGLALTWVHVNILSVSDNDK